MLCYIANSHQCPVYVLWLYPAITVSLLHIAARDHWIVKTLSDLKIKIDGLTHLVITLSLSNNIVLPADTMDDLRNLEDTLLMNTCEINW
jgi:hypothetical protein